MKVFKGRPTMEGAGVRLKRVFGFREVPQFDPFLLLDHFGSDDPRDYLAGFPWHPHRGIETVTYMIRGEVEHGDSIGNKGTIKSGGVQWMTAGGGIIHQEMPRRYDGNMMGFQLWVNLPASEKMMGPRYRDIVADRIPSVTLDSGAVVKIISGDIAGTKGPVQDIVVPIEYLDLSLSPDTAHSHPIREGFIAFAYCFGGSGRINGQGVENEQALLMGTAGSAELESGSDGMRLLLVSGRPIGEPVAWRGPIAMNTEEELDLAFRELNEGTFIKE